MNERIKELAEQSGFMVGYNADAQLERFAELVRQDEREACAKLCEDLSQKWYDEGGSASDCATAIRGRTE